MVGVTKEKAAEAGLSGDGGVGVGLSVRVAGLGSLYREQVESCIKSECLEEEMVMIELRPSRRCRVLESPSQSKLQSRCCLGDDAMRSRLINAKLHFPMPSSQSFRRGRHHPSLARYMGTC